MSNDKPTRAPARKPAAFYRPQGYVAQESVGYLMRRIVGEMAQAIDRRMVDDGLTNAQWMPLMKLSMGHADTVAELARACETDTGAMTRMLDRLEAKGLCRRERSSEDRRVVHLHLTPEGQEAAKGIPAVLSQIQNECLAGFTADEWQTLKQLLRRVLDNAAALQPAKD